MIRIIVLVAISVLVLTGLFVLLRPGPSEEGARERSIGVEISAGGMTPEEVSVNEGDRVTLELTADRPVEIHVHGYDLEEEIGPEEETTVSFEADTTGRFPVEDHGTGAELGVVVVEPR